MSYVDKNIGKDEIVVARAKTSFIAVIPYAVTTFILTAAAFISLSASFPAFIFFIIAAIFFLFYTLSKVLTCLTTELALTNKKIIGKVGVISTNMMESPLNKINDLSVRIGLFGRLLGYGNIVISTSSGRYNYLFIEKPEEFRSMVTNQIEEFDQERIKKQAEQMMSSMGGNAQ